MCHNTDTSVSTTLLCHLRTERLSTSATAPKNGYWHKMVYICCTWGCWLQLPYSMVCKLVRAHAKLHGVVKGGRTMNDGWVPDGDKGVGEQCEEPEREGTCVGV